MKKQVKVQAEAEYLDRLDAVSSGLQAAGMTIENELRSIGNFRGVVDESKLDDLKKVAGVAGAEFVSDEGGEEAKEYRIS